MRKKSGPPPSSFVGLWIGNRHHLHHRHHQILGQAAVSRGCWWRTGAAGAAVVTHYGVPPAIVADVPATINPRGFLKINPHFGNASELKELTQAAHDRGMLVMADVVANHMGQVRRLLLLLLLLLLQQQLLLQLLQLLLQQQLLLANNTRQVCALAALPRLSRGSLTAL